MHHAIRIWPDVGEAETRRGLLQDCDRLLERLDAETRLIPHDLLPVQHYVPGGFDLGGEGRIAELHAERLARRQRWLSDSSRDHAGDSTALSTRSSEKAASTGSPLASTARTSKETVSPGWAV